MRLVPRKPKPMQTKHQIQQHLASVGHRANKRLGQHFLIDFNLMRLLIDSADIKSYDCVLEVGCGTGSLTEEIIKQGCRVVAVEADRVLTRIAAAQLVDNKNIQIIEADILQNKNTINPTVTKVLKELRKKITGRLMLVANLPYNVASSVIINLTTSSVFADSMFVTVQKEVALRMTATVSNKNYGILGIILNATGDVKVIRILKPMVFWPEPLVESAMVSFVRREEKVKRIKDINILRDVVGLFMQHRRKMLKACCKLAKGRLVEIDWPEVFKSCNINPQNRPEQIAPENYIAIANLCYTHLKKF